MAQSDSAGVAIGGNKTTCNARLPRRLPAGKVDGANIQVGLPCRQPRRQRRFSRGRRATVGGNECRVPDPANVVSYVWSIEPLVTPKGKPTNDGVVVATPALVGGTAQQ